MIHYVLVGAGEAARYADALRRLPEVRVVAVVDEDEARRRRAAEVLGAGQQAAGLGELLDGGAACDGVLLAGAPAVLDDARTAARHGKPVLLALPAAAAAEQVAALTAECAAAGVCLMVSGTLRYLPSQQVLKQRLDAGVLGSLGLLRAHCWRSAAGPAAATACRELSVVYLDLANWLFGAAPELVYARGVEPAYVQIHLGFSGGGMALIDVSDDLPPGDGYRSVTVIGSAGAGYADDHHNRNLVFGGGDAAARDPGEGNLDLVAELKEFTAASSEQRAPRVTGADAGAALQVAAAAASSAATGAVLERKGDHYE